MNTPVFVRVVLFVLLASQISFSRGDDGAAEVEMKAIIIANCVVGNVTWKKCIRTENFFEGKVTLPSNPASITGRALILGANDVFRFYYSSVKSAESNSITPLVSRPIEYKIYCDRISCLMPISDETEIMRKFYLAIDLSGKLFYDEVDFGGVKAELGLSGDADAMKKEITLKSNTPLSLRAEDKIELVEKLLKIDEAKGVAFQPEESEAPKLNATIKEAPVNNQPNEYVLKLQRNLRDGTTRFFSLPKNTVKALDGRSVTASGSIKIEGAPEPPDDPKTSITVSSVAAKYKSHILTVAGTLAFREEKFSRLVCRTGNCFDDENGEKRSLLKTIFLGSTIARAVADEPDTVTNKSLDRQDQANLRDYFGGVAPKITFDVGSFKSESKKSIIMEAPFKYYVNLTNRKRRNIDQEKDQIPLNTYGGWLETPLLRLADIKTSFGPKLELYRSDSQGAHWYSFKPKTLLISTRADLEFHRMLGTLSQRRQLLKADFVAANRATDFAFLDGPNFGWKFVPFFGLEAGKSIREPKVDKTINGVPFSLTIPKYNVFRTFFGVEGSMQWLVLRRPVSLSSSASLYYLGATEKGSVENESSLDLRNIEGFQPSFKVEFEFALDPAARFHFATKWENGRAFPGLEYLNRVTTGVKITRK